jgi:hypothetical protein
MPFLLPLARNAKGGSAKLELEPRRASDLSEDQIYRRSRFEIRADMLLLFLPGHLDSELSFLTTSEFRSPSTRPDRTIMGGSVRQPPRGGAESGKVIFTTGKWYLGIWEVDLMDRRALSGRVSPCCWT